MPGTYPTLASHPSFTIDLYGRILTAAVVCEGYALPPHGLERINRAVPDMFPLLLSTLPGLVTWLISPVIAAYAITGARKRRHLDQWREHGHSDRAIAREWFLTFSLPFLALHVVCAALALLVTLALGHWRELSDALHLASSAMSIAAGLAPLAVQALVAAQCRRVWRAVTVGYAVSWLAMPTLHCLYLQAMVLLPKEGGSLRSQWAFPTSGEEGFGFLLALVFMVVEWAILCPCCRRVVKGLGAP